MDDQARKTVRSHYAQGLLQGIEAEGQEQLVSAFASVAREDYLKPPPWRILPRHGRKAFYSDDISMLYHDCLVALDEQNSINNGSPAMWAATLCELVDWQATKHVLHCGCGAGYYTAVIAEVLSSSGDVAFTDVNEELESMAVNALHDRDNASRYRPQKDNRLCLLVYSFGVSSISLREFKNLRGRWSHYCTGG